MDALLLDIVQGLVVPILDRYDVFLVDICFRRDGRGTVLEIFADTDTGITLDQLDTLTKEISAELDRSDPIPGRFRLEVSSPGIERSLKLMRQYRNNIGRYLSVSACENETHKGKLISVDDTSIVIECPTGFQKVLFTEISEAVVIPRIR
jgi:ribosome maturation factor RimP